MTKAKTTKTYYAVPTHYTIGAEFDTFEAAVAHAASTIETFDYTMVGRGTSDSRAFVDERQRGPKGDHPVNRWEVFKNGDVKYLSGSEV